MDRFLVRLRDSGNVRASCHSAEIPRSTAYYWRGKFKWFSGQWQDALDDACDILEATAWKRAVDGNSDQILMFLLRAHRRDVYDPPKRQEFSGKGKDGALLIEYVNDWRELAGE